MKKWIAIALLALVSGSLRAATGVIDGWDFNIADNANIALATSVSDLGGGGIGWADKINTSIVGNKLRFGQVSGQTGSFVNLTPSVASVIGSPGGVYECYYEATSADFTATATANQKATMSFGFRGPGNVDLLARIQYEGQLNVTNVTYTGGTNTYADADQIELLISDAGTPAWFEAFVIPGHTLTQTLKVRYVVNLDNGTTQAYATYPTLNGGVETQVHAGTIPSGWTMSNYRMAQQTLNGGSVWEVGDTLDVDNLTYSLIAETVPPPATALVDLWEFEGLTNGAPINMAASTGYVGGVTFAAASMCSITNLVEGSTTNGVLQFTATGVANESAFRTATPSTYVGETNGVYEFAFDIPSVDWSLTQAAGSNANFGFEIRDALNRALTIQTKYVASSDEIRLDYSDANGTVTMKSIPGATASGLGMRCVFNLDDAGNAGSAQFYFTENGVEVASTYNATVFPSFDFTQYRLRAQALNGTGNGWQIGDYCTMDNLRVEKIAAMPAEPVYSDKVVYQMSDTGGTLLNALAQTGSDGGHIQGTDANIATDGSGSLVFTGNGTNDITRKHFLDIAYGSGLHRLEFAFDDWNLDASEDTSSLKFGLVDSSGTNIVQFGIDVNTNSATVRFRASASYGGAGQDFYDHAGYVASTGVVLRLDINLDAGFFNASWRYDNQTDEDYVTVVGGASIGPMEDIAEIRLSVNAGANTGFSLADYINVDYLKHSTTSGEAPPTPTEYYNAWLSGYPGLGASTNLIDDSDGDYLDNLAEYAFGGDPTDGNDRGYNAGSLGSKVSIGGTNYIEYVYVRRIDQASRGIATWIELTDNLVFSSFTNDVGLYTFVGAGNLDDTWRAVTNNVRMDAAARFIRTGVSLTP